jgi:hypothetical protein
MKWWVMARDHLYYLSYLWMNCELWLEIILYLEEISYADYLRTRLGCMDCNTLWFQIALVGQDSKILIPWDRVLGVLVEQEHRAIYNRKSATGRVWNVRHLIFSVVQCRHLRFLIKFVYFRTVNGSLFSRIKTSHHVVYSSVNQQQIHELLMFSKRNPCCIPFERHV